MVLGNGINARVDIETILMTDKTNFISFLSIAYDHKIKVNWVNMISHTGVNKESSIIILIFQDCQFFKSIFYSFIKYSIHPRLKFLRICELIQHDLWIPPCSFRFPIFLASSMVSGSSIAKVSGKENVNEPDKNAANANITFGKGNHRIL